MDIQKNISEAIEYAKGLFTDFGRLIILIILNLIPIVNFIVMGYYAKCIKETPASDSPPELTDYGHLWVQGAKIFVATLVYMIIPIILIAFMAILPLTMMLPFATAPSMRPYGFFFWPVFSFLGLIGIVIAFVSALLLAMGIVNMVKKDSLSKAFAVHEILDIIRNVGWGSYIIWAVVIFIITVVVGLLGAIPYIGWLITLVISPAFGVFAARSATLVYLEGLGEAAPALEVPPSIDTKYCINCGAKIPIDAEFCPKCGRKQ